MSALVSRRALLSSALCVAAGTASEALPLAARRDVRSAKLADLVPSRFAGFTAVHAGEAVVPDARDQATIARAYDESFSRVYRDNSDRLFMLVIAHGDTKSGMLAIHRPATCYTAQGFTVEPQPELPLNPPLSHINAERMLAVRGERVEPVVYWMTIAGRQTGFGISQNLAVVRAAFERRLPEGYLIRGSVIGTGEESDYAAISRFLTAMVEASPGQLRQQLGG
jgi:EpsI family protein